MVPLSTLAIILLLRLGGLVCSQEGVRQKVSDNRAAHYRAGSRFALQAALPYVDHNDNNSTSSGISSNSSLSGPANTPPPVAPTSELQRPPSSPAPPPKRTPPSSPPPRQPPKASPWPSSALPPRQVRSPPPLRPSKSPPPRPPSPNPPKPPRAPPPPLPDPQPPLPPRPPARPPRPQPSPKRPPPLAFANRPPSPRPPVPRPSPSPPIHSTRDGYSAGDESLEADNADGGPEAPDWPPWSPIPAHPANTPSPPPPASPSVIGRFEQIGNAMMIAVHLIAVPGTDKFFFMERPSGRHPDGSRTIAGFLDLPSRSWTHVFSPDGLFCAGHTFLSSGDLLVVGGHQANAGYPDGMRSIRTFNRSCTDLRLRKIRDLGWRRWYPSATLLPDGQVLIMGGTQGVGAGTANNPFWELYNHVTNRLTPYAMRTAYLDSAQQVYYPFNYVLPHTGLLFTFCGRTGWILDWRTNTWAQQVPRLRGYASTQYPFTGTSVMLGLYPERGYEVEIMLFGGQAERATRNLSTVATRSAQRLLLSYDAAAGNYSFDGWKEEAMSTGRLMGDSVLLPNGKVVILNGAREGLAGDSASGGDSRANDPVLFADLYDPDAPRGARFRRLALSRIPRMYHSTACLTTNGTILVAGCDRCHRFYVSPEWTYDPSPTGKVDYRLEIFSPPYVFYESAKPRIKLVQSEEMRFGQPFDIAYSWPEATPAGLDLGGEGTAQITRVVLVAPCSCTHSYDMNQRLVGLQILRDWNRAVPDAEGGQRSDRVVAARKLQSSGDPESRSSSRDGGTSVDSSSSGASGGARGADGGVVTVAGPPDATIAPPGMYMLFLLNGDVYSSAVWIRLVS